MEGAILSLKVSDNKRSATEYSKFRQRASERATKHDKKVIKLVLPNFFCLTMNKIIEQQYPERGALIFPNVVVLKTQKHAREHRRA